MSAKQHPPGSAPGSAPGPAPLIAPHQAAVLLDQLIYEQVFECIDLEALYRVEQSLAMIVADFDRERAADLAKAIIDRALLRIPDDVRSYLHALGGPPFAGCDLCDEDAPPPGDRPRKRPPATPLKS
jgi:hypothetical protein